MSAGLSDLRRRGLADGTWPAHSVAMWRQQAADARRRREQGVAPCPADVEALDLAGGGLLGGGTAA
jgi:hypothetical protein